jgi:hypothetical protein
MSRREATKAVADKYIQKSVAPGTMRGYKREWIRWLKFAKKRGYWTAPPQPTELEDYLVNEVATRKSVSVLEAISASVSWHCAEVGKPSTFEDKRIMLVVLGMKALFCRSAQQPFPFTRLHMRKFMDIGRRSPRLWRVAVIQSVCFTDFLWFSEVAFVRLEDVSISKKKVSFRVQKAKNHRLGFDVCLPVDKKRRYCVGAYLVEYLEKAVRWTHGDSGFLCCNVDGSKFLPEFSISYSSLHSSCKEMIKAAGLDPKVYSTHSAKRGSRTATVVAGCNNAEVTLMGRWRSANNGRQYIHDGPEFRKRLSKRFLS